MTAPQCVRRRDWETCTPAAASKTRAASRAARAIFGSPCTSACATAAGCLLLTQSGHDGPFMGPWSNSILTPTPRQSSAARNLLPLSPASKRTRLRLHSLRAYALKHATNFWRDQFLDGAEVAVVVGKKPLTPSMQEGRRAPGIL